MFAGRLQRISTTPMPRRLTEIEPLIGIDQRTAARLWPTSGAVGHPRRLWVRAQLEMTNMPLT
jgi:hypothetical protein